MEVLLQAILATMSALPLWGKMIVGLIVALFFLFKSLRFVKEAEQGLRLRFGRVVRDRDGDPIILEPGFIVIIPYAENLVALHTREQPLTLSDQQILLKDKSVFSVGAAVYFRIDNAYKALFEIDEVELALKNYCMGVLRDILQNLDDADAIADTKKLSVQILEQVKTKGLTWGIRITDFKIMDCAPTAETASYINAGAAVTARKKALDDAKIKDPMMAAALLGAQAVNTVNTASD